MARTRAFWVRFGNFFFFKLSKSSVFVQGLSPSVFNLVWGAQGRALPVDARVIAREIARASAMNVDA